MAFICPKCSNKKRTVEFPSLKQLNAHNKGGHKLPSWVKDKEGVPEGEKPIMKPIELHYKYKGSCPKCGRAVETLLFEIGSKETKSFWAVAYCMNCREKKAERKVVPIK